MPGGSRQMVWHLTLLLVLLLLQAAAARYVSRWNCHQLPDALGRVFRRLPACNRPRK